MFPVPRPVVPSTPDGEYVNARSAHGAARASPGESRPQGRPLTPPTREPTCRTARASLMIDPVATTPKRPAADPRRPRGREALSTHPPTPVDDTPTGSLEQPAEDTSATRDAPPETADLWNTQPQPGARHRLSTGAARCSHTPTSPRATPSPTSTPSPTTSPPFSQESQKSPAVANTPSRTGPTGSENGRHYPNRLAVRVAVGRVVSYV